ncbi:hypothetical protein M9458_024124, partial [Cirrhinus mrigala]
VRTRTTAVRPISCRLFTFQHIPDVPQPGAEGPRGAGMRAILPNPSGPCC